MTQTSQSLTLGNGVRALVGDPGTPVVIKSALAAVMQL